MGLLDRILGQPDRDDERPLDTRRPVSFAVERIDPSVRPDRRQQQANVRRSDELWAAYEIGEIGYIVDFFANALRRCRVFPAGVDDPEEGRIPLDECDWATPQLASDAAGLLDRVRSVEHGQGEILGAMAQSYKVPGAGALYADIGDLGLENWEVLSTSSLVYYRGQWCRKATPDDKKPEPINPDHLWKFWQRHPRWPGLAYSEMARILGHAENLQLIERTARSRQRSRVAGAGMLLMSNRHAFKSARPGQGKDFFDDLLEHMVTPQADEGSVASFVPHLVDVDVDDIRTAAMHITFDNPLSEMEMSREDRLLRRIAQGMDCPPELVTGMADLNHWTAWQVEDSTYEAHVEPLALRCGDTLASAVMWNGLLALGYPADLVARVMVGVDASDLIRRPNRGQDARDAHAALVISDATFRQELKFTDDDAPSEDELLRRMALKRGITTETLTRELLRDYAGAELIDTVEDAAAAQATGQAEGVAETGGTAGDGAPIPDDSTTAAAIVASAVSGLGDRLHALDVALTATILGAAETATQVALDRAAGRVRNQVRRTEFAATAAGPARGVLARIDLDPSTDRGRRFDVSAAVTEADFDALHDTWTAHTTATYQAAAGALATTVPDANVDDHQDDIDAGWAVLVAALLASTRTALATPADQPLTEAVGETDPQALVQPGAVRQALARAGGATGSVSEGGAVLVDSGTRAAGGIATGENLLDAANQAGLLLTGWTWHVGAPATIFPPHHDLEGVAYSSPTDTRLVNDLGQWPGNSYWYPSDHLGCRCTAEPTFEIPSSN